MAWKTAATYESDLFRNQPPPPPLTDSNTSRAEATVGSSPTEVESSSPATAMITSTTITASNQRP